MTSQRARLIAQLKHLSSSATANKTASIALSNESSVLVLKDAARASQQIVAASGSQSSIAKVAINSNVKSTNMPHRIGDTSSAMAARERMVTRLCAQISVPQSVQQAMLRVTRHAFIASALFGKAYEDNSLPIGFGQTISKPSVVARMLQLMLQSKTSNGERIGGRVLEIGTGCGYQAALLSCIADEVYSIERIKSMHEIARNNLRPMRIPNLHLLFGDGMKAYTSGAPYAAIISAAGGMSIPEAWIDQLAVGGRIIAPTQTAQGGQVLMVIDKTAHAINQSFFDSVHFVSLKSGVD